MEKRVEGQHRRLGGKEWRGRMGGKEGTRMEVYEGKLKEKGEWGRTGFCASGWHVGCV